NRNPVSAAQLDKVNVAIAATGTGVTLTATPQGDDADATGPYRKYSLVPDTASYATQAIRYNTVTVQVNGAKIGTEYHAAWSPDITLDRSNAPVYSDEEVRSIVTDCPAKLLVDTTSTVAWKVYTVGGTQPAATSKCGTDAATNKSPRVSYHDAVQLTNAKVNYYAEARSGYEKSVRSTLCSLELKTIHCSNTEVGSLTRKNSASHAGGGVVIDGNIYSAEAVTVVTPAGGRSPNAYEFGFRFRTSGTAVTWPKAVRIGTDEITETHSYGGSAAGASVVFFPEAVEAYFTASYDFIKVDEYNDYAWDNWVPKVTLYRSQTGFISTDIATYNQIHSLARTKTIVTTTATPSVFVYSTKSQASPVAWNRTITAMQLNGDLGRQNSYITLLNAYYWEILFD
ncbi:hypothetical protein K7Z63_004823, partial [Salmonella enterica]|nr:hypothetical protein [Salmonella enterica]